jgi:hypothetical protein
MATQQQFKDFLYDIEPSKTTKEKASKAHEGPRDYLATHETFKQYHVKTFLSGSYARSTAIRPRTQDGKEDCADIDIIVVTNHTKKDKPETVINLLFNTLKEKYADVKKAVRSVRITTTDFHIDIVPIIAPDGIEGTLYLPDRNLKDWVETNPPKHTQWTTEVNEKTGGRFKPLVKLVKWWRRENDTGFRKPKGFVMECMVAYNMNSDETQYQELFVGTFEKMVSAYWLHVAAGIVPPIQDPAVASNSVTNGMEFEEFKTFYDKLEEHANLGRKAINESDDDKQLEMWRKIFGARFPKNGSSKSAESLLASAVIAPRVEFPNREIRPRKPGEFA